MTVPSRPSSGAADAVSSHVEARGKRLGGVDRVEGRKHQVPRERRLNGDLRGLEIANLADHDDVGVLPHDGAQRAGKGQIDLRFNLNLVDRKSVV